VDVVVSAPRDPAASDFESWATARLAALTRFAYLLTGSQSAADDAVQSALVRVCERWSRISRSDDPDAYVRRMVVNAHISSWRKTGRREWPVSVVRERTVSDPAEDVAGADAIWRLCAQLPAQQRAAVVLRFYEDLGYAEIAPILGVSQATARSHVHRALEALRRGLRDIEEA
jgi:RNA polymerase sigma-70 factor (sigma-E family)